MNNYSNYLLKENRKKRKKKLDFINLLILEKRKKN
jgi:hypothetical protein